MKRLIVMLLAWAAVCLLSLPDTAEKEGASKDEIALATSLETTEDVQQPIIRKLP